MSINSDIKNEENEKLPLVTFALFSYNQERYIREAVEGALSQTYSPLQIILSDDCSSDNTFEIMQTMVKKYLGPSEIILNRNPHNFGICSHVNRIMELAKGELIVIAAGDDISLPNRVARSVEILRENPLASMVGFTDITIDKDSKEVFRRTNNIQKKEYYIVTLSNYLSGKSPHLSGASRCFNRKLIDTFNELNDLCPAEDGPYLLRGLMLGYGIISPEPGIKYRRHENNLSGTRSIHAMNFIELKKQGQKDLDVAITKSIVKPVVAKKIESWIEENYQRRTFFSGLYYSQSKIKYFTAKGIINKNIKLREKLTIARMLLDPKRSFVCDL